MAPALASPGERRYACGDQEDTTPEDLAAVIRVLKDRQDILDVIQREARGATVRMTN